MKNITLNEVFDYVAISTWQSWNNYNDWKKQTKAIRIFIKSSLEELLNILWYNWVEKIREYNLINWINKIDWIWRDVWKIKEVYFIRKNEKDKTYCCYVSQSNFEWKRKKWDNNDFFYTIEADSILLDNNDFKLWDKLYIVHNIDWIDDEYMNNWNNVVPLRKWNEQLLIYSVIEKTLSSLWDIEKASYFQKKYYDLLVDIRDNQDQNTKVISRTLHSDIQWFWEDSTRYKRKSYLL